MEVPYTTKSRATIWSSNPTTEHIPWENHDSKRHMCSLNVHCSSIYKSQDMSTDRWMDKDVVHNEMFKWVIYVLQCKLFKLSPQCFQINNLFIILFSFPCSRFWISFHLLQYFCKFLDCGLWVVPVKFPVPGVVFHVNSSFGLSYRHRSPILDFTRIKAELAFSLSCSIYFSTHAV